MDYEQLYKRLAQEIIKAEGKIGTDTQAFVEQLIKKLRAEGYQLSGDAETALNHYLSSMETAVKAAITQAVVIGSGMAVTPASLQSRAVLSMAEQAFIEQWPDGLQLSDRLWRWNQAARAGVQAQLQAGIKQAKSTGSVLYDMQRTIERANAGQRFKIVSDHADPWVEELHHAAQQMIHNPEMKADWQKVVDDVEAHISELSRTGTRNAAERLLSQIKKAVEKGNEALLDGAVKWWTYDQQLYHLKRIVRTEMATAAHRAVIDSVAHDESIIGFQWRLSSSHPVTDICDYYASIEMGLGKGVWTREAVPRHKAHPHCMCLLIPRVTPIKQKGDKNYAEFIKNTSRERRDQLLPKWAKQAVDGGLPLEQLLRPDGFGLITKAVATDKLNINTVENIVAKLAEKAKNAANTDALWTNPGSLQRHIIQRQADQHIASTADYRAKIQDTLQTAKRMTLAAHGKFPLVEFSNGDWSVILDHNGGIKTAYPIEPDKKTFSDNQTRLNYNVYDYPITPGISQAFSRLFRPR